MTKSHQQGLVLELRLVLYGTHCDPLNTSLSKSAVCSRSSWPSRGLGQGPLETACASEFQTWCCRLRPPPTQHLTASTATLLVCPPTPERKWASSHSLAPSSMTADKCQHSATRNVPPPGETTLPALPCPACPHPAPASQRRSFQAQGPEELLSRRPRRARPCLGQSKPSTGLALVGAVAKSFFFSGSKVFKM